MDLNSLQYAVPANWQDFELLCRDLWAKLWEDPDAQLNGRPGQTQNGVDIFGRPRGATGWAGVQCKRKDLLSGGQLTRAEIDGEVDKAKRFDQGKLVGLVIATTAPRDKNIQAIAREITREHEKTGLFPVTVYGWQDICRAMADYPQLVRKHLSALQEALGPHPLRLPFGPLGALLKGREVELEALEKGLEGVASGVIQRPEVLHGLGGVGKTALAVEHAWRCRERYSGVFFVRAEAPEQLRAGLGELATVLNLPETRDEEATVRCVLGWLEVHPGWLLILDSVNDEDARGAVKALMPRLVEGRVMITSRLKNWPAQFQRIPIGTLALEDAVAFLLDRAAQRMETSDEAEQVEALAKELGHLPLALEQAAAFVDVHVESFSDYRQRLREETSSVLAWYDSEVMEYPRPIAITWQSSFVLLGISGRAMLYLSAFLAPEGIQRSFFHGRAADEVICKFIPDFNLTEAVQELSAYSFLRATAVGLAIHSMVQEVVRSRLSQTERSEWVSGAVDLLEASQPADPEDANHLAQWRVFRPHAESVIRHAGLIGLKTSNSASLMSGTAKFLAEIALFSEAETLSCSALKIDRASLGANHPKIARNLELLGNIYRVTNRISDSELPIRQALEIDESAFGPNHPVVARDLTSLAILLLEMNNPAEAEPLMRRALEIDESTYGANHRDVAKDLSNLAVLLRGEGRSEEAESLIRRALEIVSSIYGDPDPNVSVILGNLATLLHSTNRPSEAEPLINRALGIAEFIYGYDHPTFAANLNNLAVLLSENSRFSEAEPVIRRSLEIDKKIFGPNHPAVAKNLNNLGTLLTRMERFSEAESLFRQALEIVEAYYGPRHPDAASSLYNLSTMLQWAGRLSEAEEFMRRAVAMAEACYGEDDPKMVSFLRKLAQILEASSLATEAEVLLRKALQIQETGAPEDVSDTAISLYDLALLLRNSGRLEEALALMRKAVEIWEKDPLATEEYVTSAKETIRNMENSAMASRLMKFLNLKT